MALHLDLADWWWFVLTALAGWRLTRLVCVDAGPFQMMVSLRRLLYRARLGSLVGCFHCAAVWVAVALTLVVFEPQRRSVLLAAALAGAISVLEQHLQGPEIAPQDELS